MALAVPAAAQYCAPSLTVYEIFGKGLTVVGDVSTSTTGQKFVYTVADGTPQFGPMDLECGDRATTGSASGSIPCTRMTPNTTYYVHPSYELGGIYSTHRDCQTETVAISCGSYDNFATASAGEAACEVETDADGTNEVLKIRTPDTGNAADVPDLPTHSRAWDAGYTETPDVEVTAASTTSGGELLVTDFQARLTAAVNHLKANPTETYTINLPPSARVRAENEGGVGVGTENGFIIPACDGDETGYIIVESTTPDPDAMPPKGAPPTGNEDWASIEWNLATPLQLTSPRLLDIESPACPMIFRGVTPRAPDHTKKARWTATATSVVATPGATPTDDDTVLTFAAGALDDFPANSMIGFTVAGLKAEVFDNGVNAGTGAGSRFIISPSSNTLTVANTYAQGTPGAGTAHNIFSLPFTSASGAVMTTPAHPYVPRPTTNITSILSGVVTTAAAHGITEYQKQPVWVQGSDDGMGGDCDGVYGNWSPANSGPEDLGRDTTVLTLKDSSNANIADCNTANGTVQWLGTGMVVSDSYPTGIACYLNFPSSTSVQAVLCRTTGDTTIVPDLTGETGWISYDPPSLPNLVNHRGGPLTFMNTTFRAKRPYRTVFGISTTGAGLYLAGVRAQLEHWHPVSPNPYAGGRGLSRTGGLDQVKLINCSGCSDMLTGPVIHEGGGFSWFGVEGVNNTAMPTDLTFRQWVRAFPNESVSDFSSIFDPFRQTYEAKSGMNRVHWLGNQLFGMPENNVTAGYQIFCKTGHNGYSGAQRYFHCSNFTLDGNFFGGSEILQLGTQEISGSGANYRTLTNRKHRAANNIIRPMARKERVAAENLNGYNFLDGFHTIGFRLGAAGDIALNNNLWLPNLGDADGANGDAMNMIVDFDPQLGAMDFKDNNLNVHVNSVATYERLQGPWSAVQNNVITDGAFSTIADISGNFVAFCQDSANRLDTDYSLSISDVCTLGNTRWGETGYDTAFTRATCNTSESCATRAARIFNTATLATVNAGAGPQPTIQSVLDKQGVVGPVTVERLSDGTQARISYHAPDADYACKTDYALDGVNMDTAASGVDAVWDTTGSQERTVTITGLTPGEDYDYRVRCEYQQGMARGGF